MTHVTKSTAHKDPVAPEGRLMRVVDAIDHAVDSHLPQTPDAIHRRKVALRTIGTLAAFAVGAGAYGVIPHKIESETVTVKQDESISKVLQEAQAKAAAENPKIDPADTSYIDAAYRLQHEQEVNGQGGYVKPGQQVEVDFARNWYGWNTVSAHVLPDSSKQ